MKKKLILLLFSLASLPLFAQEHFFELSLHVSGGGAVFQFAPHAGDVSTLFQAPSLGGNAGLGGTWLINSSVGLRTGVEMSIYRSEYTCELLKAKDDNWELIRHSAQKEYVEKYRGYYLQIPLMIQFQTSGEKNRLYAALGLKMGIPMDVTFEAKNSGAIIYYVGGQENTDAFSTKGDLLLKTAFAGAVEVGMKWRLSDKMSLHSGVYVDLGLDDTKESGELLPLIYQDGDRQGYKQNSIVNASYLDENDVPASTGKIVPFAAGLKVALSFGF
ncbi:MAG: PorT family protein [Prevotellaceae bacterium]|nr:PorT family protein [Prevotellaceae bacterium]